MLERLSVENILAIVTGISGLIIGIASAINNRASTKSSVKKSDIEALQEALASQHTTIIGLVEENERQRKRMKELEKCVEDYEKQVAGLTMQLAEWKQNYSKLQAENIQLQAEFKYFKRIQSSIRNLPVDGGNDE